MEGWKSAAISFGCSAAAIVATYPADTLARQFHVTNSANTSAMSLIRSMATRSPLLFYKGVFAASVTQPTYWAIYFPLYGLFGRACGENPSFKHKMAMGWTAGAIGTIVTNPLWVIRTRMQTEILRRGREFHRIGYAAVVRGLWQENGIRTFFRGTNITLVKNVQMAFLMPLFDRWTMQSRSSRVAELIGIGATVAISAALAKIVSSTLVYPLDVIRTNMRYQQGKNIRYLHVTRELLQRKGNVLNLFRGIGWYWLSSASMFAVMMTLKHHFDPKSNEKT